MTRIAEFWKHDAPTLPCCLFVDDAISTEDAEAYDCDACPVADALAELDEDAENLEAWRVFHRCVTRFSVDTHTTSLLLDGELRGRDPADVPDLMSRLTLLYDILHPPPEPK